MSLPLTTAIAAALLAIGLFCGWRGARPPNPLKGPRMIPWRFIMVTCAALLLPVVVHLLNLVGVTTGH
jgi:hypothetical protein